MNEQKPIGLDGTGYEVLKDAVLELLNKFPGLNGMAITFSGLNADSGISMEPENGALVYTDSEDIIGNVTQECQFPFYVVYRSAATSEFLKLNVVEFLDTLGAWICKEPVTINNQAHQLTEYPTLTGERKIKSVTRFNSYGLSENENKTQDWVIPITVNYTHKFTRW